MSGKYGEPFVVSPVSGHIIDAKGGHLSIPQNRRAVACTNACQGIANPAAIPALIEAAKYVLQDTGGPHCEPMSSYAAEKLTTALAALEEWK